MRKAATILLGSFLAVVTTAGALPLPVLERGLLPGDMAVALATGNQQDHAVAKGGDQYLVAWSDYRGQSVGGGSAQSGGDIFGIRLDAQGNPVDAAPFLIAGDMGLQQLPHVAWNGEAWLVLYISQDPVGSYFDYRMRAVRVSAGGEILDPAPIQFPPTQYSPNTIGLELAGQNGQWLVTRCIYHADAYGTFLAGQRIAGNGTLLDTTPIMLMDWVYGGTKTIASNGEYLVAGPEWNAFWMIKAQRVGLDGQPIGASFAVPSLNLAGNGSEYYVMWIGDYVNLVGSRMTSTGTLLTPAGTMIVPDFMQYTQSALTHDGTNWWLEWGVSDRLHTVRISAAGDVLDPNGGVLLPIVIGGNVNDAFNPVLAPRPGGGVHVFWYDLREALGNDANVFMMPVSAGNVPGAERGVSTGTRNQRTPDFAAGPAGKVAVTFVSEAAYDDRVLVHFLGADGLPITNEPIEVASGPSIGKSGIAWNGSMYLVVWSDGAIKARRMNADGSFVDATPFVVMAGFDPDVEALGDDFLIAGLRAQPQTIVPWMRIVDGPTGDFLTADAVLGGTYASTGPRVDSDGSRWIVTYDSHYTHDNAQSEALYNFVNANGTFAPAAGMSSTFSTGGTPDVAFSGSKYLFVWRSNSLANANNYISGRVMNADGTWATGNFTIDEATGRQLSPVVGWDGSTFVVAWADQRKQASFFDERTDVYGTRVSEAGTVLDPVGFPIYAGAQGDATAAIFSRTDGVSYVASARFETTLPLDSYRVGITMLGLSPSVGVAEATAPRGSWLRQNAPNPFRPWTTISYGLSRAEPARLAIYDVAGRLVRTLVDEERAAEGPHAAVWDGRDTAGMRVASGVYLYVLRTPTFTESRRLTLLK